LKWIKPVNPINLRNKYEPELANELDIGNITE
jgi:hypothetical protein